MSSDPMIGDAVRNSDTVQDELKRLHDTDGLSFRQIAALSPWQGIPPGTLCSVYKGDVRMPNEYCKQVGMVPLVKVRADMVRKTAPRGARKKYPPRKRAPRVEIALSDPEKARERLEQKLAEYRGKV